MCQSPGDAGGGLRQSLCYFKHDDFILFAEADGWAPSIRVTTGEADPGWEPHTCSVSCQGILKLGPWHWDRKHCFFYFFLFLVFPTHPAPKPKGL